MRATHPAHLKLFYFAGQYALFIDTINILYFHAISGCGLNDWEWTFYGDYHGSQNYADCRSHIQA